MYLIKNNYSPNSLHYYTQCFYKKTSIPISGTPIMFGANPIPETETSNINGSSLNQPYDTLDVSSLAGDNYNTTRAQINSSPRTPVNYHVPGHNFSNGGLKNSISQNYSTTSDEIVKQTSFVCGFYNPEYIIYSSLCSFYIPCVFMVFLYSRIFWVSLP